MTIHIPVPPARIVALGGPVTRALAVMRAAEPETDRTRLRALRKAIADRIEADIALLDALAGDADLEDSGDNEPSLGSLDRTMQVRWADGGCDDREDGDDNGIGDAGGLMEQVARHRAACDAAEAATAAIVAVAARKRFPVIQGGAA